MPSPSSSHWSRLRTALQLSAVFSRPSASMSRSHTSPRPSRSVSSWLELMVLMQLSRASLMPSASASALQRGSVMTFCEGLAIAGQLSVMSSTPSPSSSSSHTLPRPLVSMSDLRRVGNELAVVERVGNGVAVDVGVARVAFTVAVDVQLREVRRGRAVVAEVADAVAVAVQLVAVRHEGAVVVVVGLAVAVRVVGVRQRLAVVRVRHPHRATAAAATAAAAALFLRLATLAAETLRVVHALRERRETGERNQGQRERCESVHGSRPPAGFSTRSHLGPRPRFIANDFRELEAHMRRNHRTCRPRADRYS